MVDTVRPHFLARFGATFILAQFFCSVSAPAAVLDGREFFLDPSKGNCAACHQVPGDKSVSSKSRIGPELVDMKLRYSDRTQLRAAIWNLGEKNPGTIMPPYGKHRILTETEIDAVVQYLETL